MGGEVVVFGELLGGHYPEAGVVKGSKKVQKGVYYTNINEFYAFDIVVDGKYLNVDDANTILGKHGFVFARTLFRGTYHECLEQNETFQSTIPALYGMKPIEDNLAEGLVIRPVEARFLAGGSRVILKKKAAAFSEKQAVKSGALPTLSDEHQAFLDDMLSLVNENRLRNVLSKMGPIVQSDFGKVMKAFIGDVTVDFLKDNEEFNELEKSDKKRISKVANKAAAILIRENFLNILDGES